jgi:hypothetical protein
MSLDDRQSINVDMPVDGHAHTLRIGVAQCFGAGQATVASEVDQGAQAKNPGIVGLHASAIISAPSGIDHILGVELEVHPAGRLPPVPSFERNFVTACIRAEGSRIHVGRPHREADFVLGARGERAGVLEAAGDLVVLERRPAYQPCALGPSTVNRCRIDS